ncbi:MAG: PQQ-binding-like beta-propeller repeat protein [Myxococcales bacterium]|nr:PQQ-binding-like beta-propeller repeat protein [Myxococcales bacterium]MCB9713685.1 PQQ-binding-like beta-propeller repeat protein [Myxococcales bacterium]
MRARSRAGLGSLALLLALAGCGARDEVELVYPEEDAAARSVMAVDYTRPLTEPDNFVLRPDELSGVAVDPGGELLYTGSRDGYLFALRAEDGAVEWDLELGGAVSSIPVLVPAEGDHAPLLLVGTDNGVMHALDPRDRSSTWSYETPGRIRNPPLVHQGVVFFVNSRDQVYALDLRTGTWRWQYEQELQTSFTVHGHAGLSFLPAAEHGVELGTIHACFDNGKVVALAAGSGQALWIASVAPPEGGDFVDCDSTPLVDPEAGLVYVTGQSTGVVALALDSGDERWRFPMRGAGSLIAGPDGSLVGSSSLEGVFVLERDGSRLRWRAPTNPGVLSTPLVVGEVVFVTHSELGLLAFDLGTGELQAQLRTGSGMASVPVYDPVRQRLFAISNRGMFVALRVGDAVEDPWGVGHGS